MTRFSKSMLTLALGLAFAGVADAASYQYRQYLPGFTVRPQSTTPPEEVTPTTPPETPQPGTPDLLYSISLTGDTAPINLGTASAVKITKVHGGSAFYALDAEGKLWTWTGTSAPVPLYEAEGPWKDISGTRAVKQDGSLWEWGQILSTTTRYTTGGLTRVGVLNDWVSVDQSYSSTEEAVAHNSSGKACFWGFRYSAALAGPSGRFCDSTNDASLVATPTPVCTASSTDVLMSSAVYLISPGGGISSCAFNSAWTQGCTQIQIIGIGYRKICSWPLWNFQNPSVKTVLTPTALPTPGGRTFVKLAGTNNTGPFAALASDGTLWAWGNQTSAQFCQVSQNGYCSPWLRITWPALLGGAVDTYTSFSGSSGFPGVTPVYQSFVQMAGTGYVDVAMGTSVAAAVKADGTLWRWNASMAPSQVGTGTKWKKVFVHDDVVYGISGQ